MHFPDRFHGWPFWHKRGDLPFVEFPQWEDFLPRTDEGTVELNRDTAIQLAILHGRTYQDEIELLYFTALALTFERFEFDLQWFGTNATFFDVFGTGGPPFESRRLSTSSRLGFTKNLAIGGQLLVDFANSFVWEFAGGTVSSTSSSFLVSLVQPLLRGAFREVRLERLTQAERNVLYNVRDFARFRRIYYVDIVGSGGYLGLLALAQRIKNQQKNLEQLTRNLEEHEQLSRAGLVSQLQVDQVFQDYQEGRLNLLAARQSLQNRLDGFKLAVGLPPQLEMELDEEALKPFELNNPKIEDIQERNERLRLELLQDDDGPSAEQLATVLESVQSLREELAEISEEVTEELSRWKQSLEKADTEVQLSPEAIRRLGADDEVGSEAEFVERQRQLSERLEEILVDLREQYDEDGENITAWLQRLSAAAGPRRKAQLNAAREFVSELVGRRFRKQAEDLFVVQAQIRVHLIEISELEVDMEEAVSIAFRNRLDLMNARGNVVDAYRAVEVAADALEGELDLRAEAELGTDPDRNNPVRFDASANRYRVGFEFDSPLNRLAERNAYRTAQINYQQARRAYMALKDTIARQIREDVRALEFNRFSFKITRLQLLAAARQVDEAQLSLRNTQETESTATINLLAALRTLLNSKDSLIGSWVLYETSRLTLLRDLELLQVAPDGTWLNESISSINEDDINADAGGETEDNFFDAILRDGDDADESAEIIDPAKRPIERLPNPAL